MLSLQNRKVLLLCKLFTGVAFTVVVVGFLVLYQASLSEVTCILFFET